MPKRIRIVSNPEILGGKPIIEGTRIPVELVLTRIADGRSVAEILEEYPHLSRAQVIAAIDYARRVTSGAPVAAAE